MAALRAVVLQLPAGGRQPLRRLLRVALQVPVQELLAVLLGGRLGHRRHFAFVLHAAGHVVVREAAAPLHHVEVAARTRRCVVARVHGRQLLVLPRELGLLGRLHADRRVNLGSDAGAWREGSQDLVVGNQRPLLFGVVVAWESIHQGSLVHLLVHRSSQL